MKAKNKNIYASSIHKSTDKCIWIFKRYIKRCYVFICKDNKMNAVTIINTATRLLVILNNIRKSFKGVANLFATKEYTGLLLQINMLFSIKIIPTKKFFPKTEFYNLKAKKAEYWSWTDPPFLIPVTCQVSKTW